MPNKVALFADENVRSPNFAFASYKSVITDRWSKYTVSGGRIVSKDEVKEFVKAMLQKKEFHKATHNSYAYRIQLDDGWVLDGKNDDGETGAGNCVLRELQRAQIVNVIVVVTRYYGWVKLHADRFKNVIESTKIFVERIS